MAIRALNKSMRSTMGVNPLGPPTHVYRDQANYQANGTAYVAWNLSRPNFTADLRVEALAMNLSNPSVPQIERVEIHRNRIGGDNDGWRQQRFDWKIGGYVHRVRLRLSITGDDVPPLAEYSLRLRSQGFGY